MESKKCGRCNEEKPVSAFHKRARSIDGLQAFCVDCMRSSKQKWRADNPDQDKQTNSTWYVANKKRIAEHRVGYRQENKDKRNEYNREWRRRNKDKVTANYMKHAYGLSREEYDAFLEKQGGVCAICKQACRLHARLSVDHDHKTDVIRGLLCHQCNVALGHFEDDPLRLQAAIDYLIKSARAALD